MEKNRPLGWTTIEEAKMLVDAGLDPNTADMYYYARRRFDGNEYVNTGEWNLCHRCDKEKGYGGDDDFSGEERFQYLLKTFGASKYDDDDDCFVPCWSPGALFELIPKTVKLNDVNFHFYMSYDNTKKWSAVYESAFFRRQLFCSAFPNEMELLVNVIRWLLGNNNHIKKSE